MKIYEALKAIEEGKKVRDVNWEKGFYIYLCKDKNIFIDNKERLGEMKFYGLESIWEIFEEEVGDEVKPKPCFRCGNKDIKIEEVRLNDDRAYRIWCNDIKEEKCIITLLQKTLSNIQESKKEIIERWNKL